MRRACAESRRLRGSGGHGRRPADWSSACRPTPSRTSSPPGRRDRAAQAGHVVFDAREHGLRGDGVTNDQPALAELVARLGDGYVADGIGPGHLLPAGQLRHPRRRNRLAQRGLADRRRAAA